MIKVLATGIVFGLTICFIIGPFFIAMIYEALHGGKKSGILFASGGWTSDLFVIMVIEFGLSRVMQSALYNGLMSFFAVLILVYFGISFIKKSEQSISGERKKAKGKIGMPFIKGFSLSLLTPFTPVFWLGVYSQTVVFRFSRPERYLFFMAVIGTLALTDIVKVLLADKISEILENRYVKTFKLFLGLIMLAAAIFVFLRIYVT